MFPLDWFELVWERPESARERGEPPAVTMFLLDSDYKKLQEALEPFDSTPPLWEAQKPSESGIKDATAWYDKYKLTAEFLSISVKKGVMGLISTGETVHKVAANKIMAQIDSKRGGMIISRWEITFTSLPDVTMFLLDSDYKKFQEATEGIPQIALQEEVIPS